jgi:para-aminobenzoate synthetase component 1
VSKTVHLDEIPYCPDSCDLFERLRDLPGAAMLDSTYPHTRRGRYDILTADPAPVDLPRLPANADESACRRFFDALSGFHREHYTGIQPAAADIPFCGGILGHLPYDYGNALHQVGSPADVEFADSDSLLAAYDWCVVQDHLLERAVLVSLPQVDRRRRADLQARLRRPVHNNPVPFRLRTPFTSNLDEAGYRQAFEAVQAYIQAGDCYQVNLAQRFSAPCEGDPWPAYRALRGVAAAPFAAYLARDEGGAVMCLSPERFLALHGHRVETSPIKGTRPRQGDARADELAATELRSSEKDRAENLMIVDLLRNDLGRSCLPGSIHVDRLFELQSFPTVHHLVSTISGELREDCAAFELLRDSFPGGSITGAPKRRAMQIIAELEPDSRQAYCGSVLYVSADGRMDSNIAIRTLLCQDGNLHCWGGGGIVADSQWQWEYQETYDKVGRFLTLLENLGKD